MFGDRHHLAGPELDVDVDAAALRRVDQPVAGDDLRPLAGEPAEGARDPAGGVLALLEADDVGARGPDRLQDLGERLRAAAALRAPVAGPQVELVAAVEDVEGHDPQANAALAADVVPRRRRRGQRPADQEPDGEQPQAPPDESMPGDGHETVSRVVRHVNAGMPARGPVAERRRTLPGMGVAYSSPDSPLTRTLRRLPCRCGAHALRGWKRTLVNCRPAGRPFPTAAASAPTAPS